MRDFIFRIKPGEALPPADPNGARLLMTPEGELKILGSNGTVSTVISGFSPTITDPQEGDFLVDIEGKGQYVNYSFYDAVREAVSDIIDDFVDIPKKATVTISSAQILAMGTTPIELLPAPGVNMYYDIKELIVEYTYGTQAYVPVTTHFNIITGTISQRAIDNTLIASTENAIGFFNDYGKVGYKVDKAVFLGTQGNFDPTDGDGTLLAIIHYTVRTFGE